MYLLTIEGMDKILPILVLIIGSTALAHLLTAANTNRLARKKLIADATRSALKRVEMYYRVSRRTDDRGSDAISIRDEFHGIQEDNEYYKGLLSVESVWLGQNYSLFIEAIKSETRAALQEAWKNKTVWPGGSLEKNLLNHEKINKYTTQFSKDSRRLFNPLMRVWMRIRYALRKHIKSTGYES